MNEPSAFKTMGVVNLTPDSFSDGGEVTSVEDLQKKVEFLRSHGTSIFDFGAESTAPASNSIDAKEEKDRFELLFEAFDSLKLHDATLSIDTYRPQTFLWAFSRLQKCGFKGELFWNDVSGVVDGETKDVLKELPDTGYILAHTNIPTKEDTSRHMDYVDDNLNTSSLVDKLKDGMLKLHWIGHKNIILDPCFGFSKTKEQNLMILARLNHILRAFEREASWVWGTSRKSMIQKLFETPDVFQWELVHLLSLRHIQALCPQSIFRVHDPRLTRAIKVFDEAMEMHL